MIRKHYSKKKNIPNNSIELKLKSKGIRNIIGIDEVGRGCVAGPIVSCAIRLPSNRRIYKIRDSKLLNPFERESLAKRLKKICTYAIGKVEVKEINQYGMGWAIQESYRRAIRKLKFKPGYILIDGVNRIKWEEIRNKKSATGNQKSDRKSEIRKQETCHSGLDPESIQIDNLSWIPHPHEKLRIHRGRQVRDDMVGGNDIWSRAGNYVRKNDYSQIPQKAIIKGDMKVASIAAASIIAKTYRDGLMTRLSKKDGRYYYHKHKGYCTKLHREKIILHGKSRNHRNFKIKT